MKLPDPFALVPLDKQAHFFVGMSMVLAFALFGHSMVGLGGAILAGVFKEWVWDHYHPVTHTVDPWDFAATVSGGLVAFSLDLIARVTK